jgi:hypothetical protein
VEFDLTQELLVVGAENGGGSIYWLENDTLIDFSHQVIINQKKFKFIYEFVKNLS